VDRWKIGAAGRDRQESGGLLRRDTLDENAANASRRSLAQVEGRDLVAAEEHVEAAVRQSGAQRDLAMDKGAAEL
jgi:hypothetical protein